MILTRRLRIITPTTMRRCFGICFIVNATVAHFGQCIPIYTVTIIGLDDSDSEVAEVLEPKIVLVEESYEAKTDGFRCDVLILVIFICHRH